MFSLLVTTLFLAFSQVSSQYPPELFSPLINSKIQATAQKLDPGRPTYPQYTDGVQGNWQFFSPDTWTSGFFPATLYAMNTRERLCSGSTSVGGQPVDWVDLGRGWSTGEIPLETQTSVGHDVGFLSFPFVNELEINLKNETALAAVNAFAEDLAARFSPIVGCTRSWDKSGDPDVFQVIIDNMMNLEVLFVSEELTGNHKLRDIAIAHADTTMKHHLRHDGDVIAQRTQQGYADNSTWSRGQAWGIYGFANMHKRTGQQRYIDTARHMATLFLALMPDDGIVPWDFNAPLNPPRPADSSAATIVSTALLLLSQQEASLSPPDLNAATKWSDAAQKILSDTTKLAWQPSWQSLLSNGTVNNPIGNSLTGTVYGDYYYIRSGNELVSMALAKCP